MFGFFDRKRENKPPVKADKKKKQQKRNFIGARFTEFNRFNESFCTINQQLKTDYIALTLRARSLYKNEAIIHSYVDNMIRSVIGPTGMQLNVTAYNDDGTSDVYANDKIESLWYEYENSIKHYVDASQTCTGRDFDAAVLFSLIVDGECFLRKIKDKNSKFGIRFEILDSLNVDTLYNMDFQQDGSKICMGIKVDEHDKPISYFIRENKGTDYYLTGNRIEVPANQVIHLYRKLYPGQIRGFTSIAPVMLSLNSLDEYKRAQTNSALLQSCWMGLWEKQSADANSYDDYDEQEVDNSGNVAYGLEQGTIKYSPDGYKLQQVTPTHPNSNFKDFIKALTKNIAGALGLNYYKLSSDYAEGNYSSLKMGQIEDSLTVKDWQQFLIQNWKDVEYHQFLKYLLLSDLTNLPYSKFDKFQSHDFKGYTLPVLDEQKQMAAIEAKLKLGLVSPIQVIHDMGRDPVDVLNSISKFLQMCKDRGIQLSDALPLINKVDDDTDLTIDDNNK